MTDTATAPLPLPLELWQVLEEEYQALRPGFQATPGQDWRLGAADIVHPQVLADRVCCRRTPFADLVRRVATAQLPAVARERQGTDDAALRRALAEFFNTAIASPEFFRDEVSCALDVPPTTKALQTWCLGGWPKKRPPVREVPDEVRHCNRLLLEWGFSELPMASDVQVARVYKAIRASGHESLTALVLSGGGIRSATFALGIVQGLATLEWFPRFDYLSTVSGGGYLGGWLSAWMARHPQGRGGVSFALARAPVGASRSPLSPEPEPVAHLRDYSNYLTPRAGLFTADTWTLVATFLRNLIVIWLLLVPMLAITLLMPRLFFTLANIRFDVAFAPVLAGIGVLCYFVGALYLGLYRPPTLPTPPAPPRNCPRPPDCQPPPSDVRSWRRRSNVPFYCLFLIPTVLGSLLLAFAWRLSEAPAPVWTGLALPADWWRVPTKWIGRIPSATWWVVLGAALTSVASAIGGRWWRPAERSGHYWWQRLYAVPASGALAGVLFVVAARLLPSVTQHPTLFIILALPVPVAIVGLAGTVFSALVSHRTTDDVREWWARIGAWLLIVGVVWAGLSALVLEGPSALLALYGWVAGGVGVLGTLFAIVGGKSGATPVGPAGSGSTEVKPSLTARLLNRAVVLVAPLALAFLLILVAWATTSTLGLVDRALARASVVRTAGGPTQQRAQRAMLTPRPGMPEPSKLRGADSAHLRRAYEAGVRQWEYARRRNGVTLAAELVLLVLLGVVLGIAGPSVDINRFSLHAMYRARLIRAYLAASRRAADRRPNPFTGFDPYDNMPIHALWPYGAATSGERAACQPPSRPPIHIVNATLNLVAGRNLAWQERRAESFTITPMHAGASSTGYRRTVDRVGDVTAYYGGGTGISLGTAVAISGAAASPNMGYHSSPVVTFLMTLFNARLGWWLGNPGVPGGTTPGDPWAKDSPPWRSLPIVKELVGDTTDDQQFVYLSDGGHFENLGLYEAVRRRCAVIVVSDAGEDAAGIGSDLADAIRKVRIDLGVEIRFPSFTVGTGRCFAVGEIDYTGVDQAAALPDKALPTVAHGVLVYIKTVIPPTAPRDVHTYGRVDPAFPNDTTAEQWYTESRFESYRALGVAAVDQVARAVVRARAAGSVPPPMPVPPAPPDVLALSEEERVLLMRAVDRLAPVAPTLASGHTT